MLYETSGKNKFTSLDSRVWSHTFEFDFCQWFSENSGYYICQSYCFVDKLQFDHVSESDIANKAKDLMEN